MAFDAGAIVAKLSLNNREFEDAMKRSGDTTGKMQERIRRLEDILSKTKLGSARFQQLSKTLEQTQRDFDMVTGKANALNNTLEALGSVASAGAIISGLKGFSKEAANFESTTTSFTVMLGSAEKAGAMLQKLNKFALETPFSNDEVNQAARTLLSFGFSADEVASNLMTLGNVSAGTGKNFAELAVIFGQIKASGRLLGGDLMQLVNAGFNPLQVIANKTGQSIGDLKAQMEDGLISFDMVKQAFDDAAGAGGLFDDMMQKQSKTFAGLTSNIEGNTQEIQKFFGTLVNDAMRPLMEAFNDLQTVVLNFVKDSPNTARAIGQITLALAALVAIILGANGLISAFKIIQTLAPAIGLSFSTMLGPIGLVVTAIGGVVSAALLAKARIEDLRVEQAKANTTFAELGKALNSQGYEKASALIKKYQGDVTLTKDEYKKFTATLNEAGIGTKGLMYRLDQGGKAVVLNKLRMAELEKQLGTVGKVTEDTTRKKEKLNNVIGSTPKSSIPKITDDMKSLGKETTYLSNDFSKAFTAVFDSFRSLHRELGEFGGGFIRKLSQEAKATIAGVGESLGNVIQAGFQNVMSHFALAMAKAQRRMAEFDFFSNVFLGRMRKAQEQETKRMEEEGKREVENFKKNEEAKLKAFEDAQNAQIDALKKSQIEAQALRDDALAAELRRLEEEKTAFLQQERIKFELRQAELLQTTETQAQQRIVRETNEQDWIAFVERTNREFLDRQKQVSDDAKERERTETQIAKEELVTLESTTQSAIEAEREATNDRIRQKEEEHVNRMTALKERQEQEKINAEKKSAGIRYMMEVAALEVSKQMQRAQATMQYAQSLMSITSMIIGMAGASFGLALPLALSMGAMLTGLSTSTYMNTVAAINQQVVMPPAELFMESGGLLGGNRHSNGGVMVEAERNELFIDRARTERLFNWMDQGMAGGGGVTVNIHAGAFQGVGDLSDNSIQIISERIGREIERRAF